METKTITYQHQRVVYDISSSGQPVVLVHGFGEDRDVWKNQVPVLEKQYQLIIPDLPGSGDAEYNASFSGLDDHAKVIKAIIDEEKISTCTLLGHSMGGYITLAFAELFPGMLNAFGLIHSTAMPDSEEKKEARRKSIKFIQSNGAYEFLKTSTPGLFSKGWAEDHQQEVEALIERGRRFSDESLVQYYEAMIARPDRRRQLSESKVPVLFMIGKEDNAVPFDNIMPQVYLPERSHVHILRHSGHMGMWEEKNKMNEAVKNFLEAVHI